MFDKAKPDKYAEYMMRLPAIAEKTINNFPKYRKFPLQVFDTRHIWALKAAWPGDLSATGGWLPLEFYQGRCPVWIMDSKIQDQEKQNVIIVLHKLLRRLGLEKLTGIIELHVSMQDSKICLDESRYKWDGILHLVIDGMPYLAPHETR
jgi:hypothetical protein